MIVKILGTHEVVEVPDEPHPVELERRAFEMLVRQRLGQRAPEPRTPADDVSDA